LAGTSQIIADQQGNIILYATQGGSSSGSLSINGKEVAPTGGGYGLSKINGSTGDVIWKRDIKNALSSIVLTPDGSILTIAGSSSAYSASVYSDADGRTLVSFTGAGQAMQVASGAGGVYVIGGVLTSSDFDPGARTDTQGGTSGLFVTRFSY